MKRKIKEKRLCGGKLIVKDFKKLNPKNLLLFRDFTPEQLKKELVVFTQDGKVYINTNIAGNDIASGIFEILIPESRETLKQFQVEYGRKFPNIKNLGDWERYAKTEPDNEKIVQSLALLMVPIELKRRTIESSYYGKIRAFPSQF